MLIKPFITKTKTQRTITPLCNTIRAVNYKNGTNINISKYEGHNSIDKMNCDFSHDTIVVISHGSLICFLPFLLSSTLPSLPFLAKNFEYFYPGNFFPKRKRLSVKNIENTDYISTRQEKNKWYRRNKLRFSRKQKRSLVGNKCR